MKPADDYIKILPEMIAAADADFAATQAIIDQIIKDRQALQVFFNSETERLKLENEELERSAKSKDAKFAQAQQDAQARKSEASGAAAGLRQLLDRSTEK